MKTPTWTWIGQLDLFGLEPARRDRLLRSWAAHAYEAGGDMQVVKVEDCLDSDRYQLHLEWPALALPLPEVLRRLARGLPRDHPEMRLRGYDRWGGERMDLVLRKGRVFVIPYQWEAQAEVPYQPQAEDISAAVPA